MICADWLVITAIPMLCSDWSVVTAIPMLCSNWSVVAAIPMLCFDWSVITTILMLCSDWSFISKTDQMNNRCVRDVRLLWLIYCILIKASSLLLVLFAELQQHKKFSPAWDEVVFYPWEGTSSPVVFPFPFFFNTFACLKALDLNKTGSNRQKLD